MVKSSRPDANDNGNPFAAPTYIHHSHDKLFKRALMDIEVAKDFMRIHLPAQFKDHCDLSTLALSTNSYIDDQYQNHYSDVTYEITLDDETGYIYCVVEHVSKAEQLTPFQILRYQMAIMYQHLKRLPKKERKNAWLPVVIPLIVYRGPKSPYPGPTYYLELF